MHYADHLTALCAVIQVSWRDLTSSDHVHLQSLTKRLGKDVSPLADRIMTSFLKMFHTGVKTPVIVEDVFLSIGALVNGEWFSACDRVNHLISLIVLEADFARYMEPFSPFLYSALQNHEEHQVGWV